MFTKSWRVTTALFAASVIALTGCSSGTSTSTAPGGTTAAGTATTKDTSGDKLLGIVSITATDSNNARVITGATEAAQAAGWKVEVVDAQGNADTANACSVNLTKVVKAMTKPPPAALRTICR